MEDNIQTILIFLISTILLFIFPVYMAYEKKDDVSYALALKFTQEFVETVGEKGYLTLDEYTDFRGKLATSGNMYDIELEHKYTSTIPAIKYYTTDAEGKYIYKDSTSLGTSIPVGYNKFDTYDLTTEIFKTEHIVNILDEAGIYTLNENDIFTVRVKNTNKTLATIMYNMIAFNSNTTRIYVNCSNTVTDTKWYQKENLEYIVKDLGHSLSDKRLLSTEDPIVFIENYRGTTKSILDSGFTDGSIYLVEKDFNIECKLYPIENTRIDLVGTQITPTDTGFKYFIYTVNGGTGKKGLLSISVGVNGMVVHQNIDEPGNTKKTVLSYEGLITPQTLIEITVKNNVISLFIDEKRVSTSKLDEPAKFVGSISKITANYGGPTGDEGETNFDTIGGNKYKVYPTYFKIYKTVEY